MANDFPPIPPLEDIVSLIEHSWNDLRTVVDGADPDDLVRKTDAAEWSVKDHLAHLDAWDRSVLAMVRDGRPQWEGLGVGRDLFEEEGYDRKNGEVRQQSVELSLEEVRLRFLATHEALLEVLRGLTDEAIRRPCNEYVGGSGDFEIAHKVMGNTYMHYDEHRVYIERILAS